MPDKEVPIWELGQEGGHSRPINKDVLYNNLVLVSEILNKHGVEHWLTHGTMLGVYRQNDFIDWDDDADIGARMIDREKSFEAEEELRSLGFYVPPAGDPSKPIDSQNNMPYSDSVFIKDGEKIELWWWTKIDGFYYYDIYRQPPELKHHERYYDSLSTIDFKGHTFNIPNNIAEWIVMMYGNDWNIPQKGVKYNDERGRQR